MRYRKAFTTLTLCAVLLLSGCNVETPAPAVSERKTTTSATEITTEKSTTTSAPITTTAVTTTATTTAAVTTTAASTTTAEVTTTTTAVTKIDPEAEKRRKYAEYGLDPDSDYYLPDGSKFVFPPVEEWSGEYWMNEDGYRTDLPSGIYSPGCYYMNGSTFIRFCSGESYDKVNYPDKFEGSGYARTETGIDWKKVSVGDKVGSLTVESAFTMFGYYFQDNDDGSKNWIWTTEDAEFTGSVTLEGYINRFEGGVSSGLCFYPLPDSLKENDFPMLSGSLDRGNLWYYYNGVTAIKGDTVEIDLDDSDDTIRQSICDMLEEGEAVRVKATLSDVKLHGWIEDAFMPRYCTARITDFEIVK